MQLLISTKQHHLRFPSPKFISGSQKSDEHID
jgi:hypothetical protein